jgi:hypothetical protein
MTPISGVSAGTAPAAITTNTSIASIATPKAVAQPADIGPAATVNLSQKALALLKGDKDWTPGATIDSI